ncbi:hypothetical protein [Fusobacterium varium]|uniref:hypothetical protein n=1 Tax=Fusobacterium varium TaxID=856 RepID=UPI0030CDACF6
MRLINKDIFIIALILNLLLNILAFFNNYYISFILKFLPLSLTIIVIIKFLKDEYYEYKKFLSFFTYNYLLVLLFDKIADSSSLLNFFDSINEWLALGVSFFIIIYGLIGKPFVIAFLYQFFRKKSYKEELEKAKKLLEENSISQEEFEIINKNISTAK